MADRIPVQAQARAGAVAMLVAYAASASIRLQVYPARPRSIAPPTAFVDVMRETATEFTLTTRQREAVAEVLVVHGLFDSKEAADQRDAFCDGFLDWVADNYHGFGANTLVSGIALDDEPVWVPDWQPESERKTYYATRITLRGFAVT